MRNADRIAGLFGWILLGIAFPTVALGQADSLRIAEGVISHQDLFNTSMREGVACFRIPALVTAPNGDLVAAIDERVPSCADLRGNRDINIVLRRSTDNGASWSEIEPVVDYPAGRSASDPSMIVDEATGDLFLFYNYMDLDAAPDVYRMHVVKSADDGMTWSAPRDITEQITKPGWRRDFMFITSGRGIQTRGGTLLHTLVNLDEGVHVFGSEDHGETWFLLDTAIHPADESKIVELADGSWMINSRVNDAGMRHVHVSSDSGKTWLSRPDPALVDPGSNAGFIRITSAANTSSRNILLFSNPASPDLRENLMVRLSYDEGETWTEGTAIYPGAAAYSSMTVLEDGTIGVLFEKDDYTENEFVRFDREWLADGR